MGASPRPWTPEDDEVLLRMHGEGASLHAIAKHLGRSKTTVHRAATRLELVWDRSKTAKAVEARTLDAKARRADIKLRLLTRADSLLSRLESDTFTTLVPTGGGEKKTRTLTYVPPEDERHVAQSLSSYLSTYDRLDKLDTDSGVATAVSMLGDIITAIREVADEDVE